MKYGQRLNDQHDGLDGALDSCDDPTSARDYAKFIFSITARIIWSKRTFVFKHMYPDRPNLVSYFACLRNLVSGEVDADRIDYTLRDPVASGVTDRTFDVHHLTSNFVLHYDNSEFRMCVNIKALSALETMFAFRYLNYRTIIFHHSVVRMNHVLQEIVRQVIRICYVTPTNKMAEIAQEFGLIKIDKENLGRSVLLPDLNRRRLDEGWLQTMLERIRQEIQTGGEKATELQQDSDTTGHIFRPSHAKLVQRLEVGS